LRFREALIAGNSEAGLYSITYAELPAEHRPHGHIEEPEGYKDAQNTPKMYPTSRLLSDTGAK
jgi:hypothetical protein